jgi:hypothetical protein
MMSYDDWLACILHAAQNIASRAFQEDAWKAGGKLVSSPDEVYQVLIEDCTPDLFFEVHGKSLSDQQVRCWNDLKSRLTSYYERMPLHPDHAQVLEDPEWDVVRQTAAKLVLVFNGNSAQPSE